METQPTLLLVEDDPEQLKELRGILRRAGFVVEVAMDGETALNQIMASSSDLVILDVELPKLDGREVLRRLRQAGNRTPIILLSRYGDPDERAMAINEEADDYVNKPFSSNELVARIKNVLRRARPGQPPLGAATYLISGKLKLERKNHLRAWLGTNDLGVGPTALRLLNCLMTHHGETVTREQLWEEVWGYSNTVSDLAINARIAELRGALEDDPAQPYYIETILGRGYKFIGVVEASV